MNLIWHNRSLKVRIGLLAGAVFVAAIIGLAIVGGSSSGATGANTYEKTVLADSPLSYWRMDVQSGTSETDLGSLALNGTYAGSPRLKVAGAVSGDQAVTFASPSHQMMSGSDSNRYSFVNAKALTVECWARWTAVPAETQYIVSKGSRSNFEWAILILPTGETKAQIWKLDGATLASVSFGDPSLTTYHHLVFTVLDTDGTATVRTYLDGAETTHTATFKASDARNGTAKPLAGGRGDGAGYFDGQVDEYAIYGTTLSAARISAHFNASGMRSA
jgi:hypothetical protein